MKKINTIRSLIIIITFFAYKSAQSFQLINELNFALKIRTGGYIFKGEYCNCSDYVCRNYDLPALGKIDIPNNPFSQVYDVPKGFDYNFILRCAGYLPVEISSEELKNPDLKVYLRRPGHFEKVFEKTEEKKDEVKKAEEKKGPPGGAPID